MDAFLDIETTGLSPYHDQITVVGIATGEGDDSGESFIAIMGGGGPTTDAQGRFTVGRLGPGEGQLMLFNRDEPGSPPLFPRPLQLTAGQKLDLGTITVGGEGIDAGE